MRTGEAAVPTVATAVAAGKVDRIVVLPYRSFNARYRGSRSFRTARIGVAMKIDE